MLAEATLTIMDHVRVLLLFFPLAIVIVAISVKRGFFALPKRKSLIIKNYNYKHLLGAFFVCYFFVLFSVPLLIVFYGLIKKSLFFLSSISFINLEFLYKKFTNLYVLYFKRVWFYFLTMLITTFAMITYLRILPKNIREGVYGVNMFKGFFSSVKDLYVGFLTLFICYPSIIFVSQCIAVIAMYFGIEPYMEQDVVDQLKHSQDSELFLLVICVIIFAPILEEILFRGFLLTWLRNKMGILVAILLSSVIFAFFHFSLVLGLANINLLVSIFILACFMGFIRERQQSLLAPIGLHFVFNTYQVIRLLL